MLDGIEQGSKEYMAECRYLDEHKVDAAGCEIPRSHSRDRDSPEDGYNGRFGMDLDDVHHHARYLLPVNGLLCRSWSSIICSSALDFNVYF
jgi:hypothetical protein